MRSVLVLLGAYGAVAGNSGACDVDPDANSLLQAKSLVRSRTKLTGVQELLKSVRSVADSLAEGSDASMTPEDVNDAIGTATSALQTMLPSFAEQHAMAQREIADALRAVEACHDQHGGNLMTRLEQAVTTHRGEKEQCDGSLEDATAAEGPACAGQGANPNCLCNEARTAVADQTVLCASVTTMYGMAFCSHHDTCGLLHHCHATEVAIYNALRTDVEAAMVSRQEQYRTVRQSECLMELITSAMLSGTPIPHASLTSCDDVSVADLIIHFPNVPANPSSCPSPTGSDPQCAAECAVEVATSTRSHGDTSSGASMQFQVDGHWTAAQDFPSNIARGEIVTATASVSARPSAVRIVAGGSNAWGYTRVSVTCDGESVLVLEGDEHYGGGESDIHFWVDGNQAAPEMQEYQIGSQCAVEVATSTRTHADTSSGASMQLQVDGHWTAAQDFPSNIARGEIVTATTSVSARPSAVRIVAGGSSAWGYTRVSVTCDGESVLVLEGDEHYGGDVHFWVDGNEAAPEMQEYQIPALS